MLDQLITILTFSNHRKLLILILSLHFQVARFQMNKAIAAVVLLKRIHQIVN